MEQQQILARWRRELRTATTEIQARQTSVALDRINSVTAEIMLAQIMGLPDHDAPDEP